MATRRTDPSKRRCFLLIDPLRPPSDTGTCGRLASIVSASTTWFFAEPVTDRNRTPAELCTRTLSEIEEAVEAAHELLRAEGVAVDVTHETDAFARDRRGYQLVDLFCNKHMRKERGFPRQLSSGRSINQRQLLSAMALYQAEQTARAAANGDVSAVCDLMEDLLELVCEMRRALDREAGSSIAARRARARNEVYDRIKARACELYDRQAWPSIRKASQKLFPEVQQFSRELGTPLSLDSGELTLNKWLRAHKNSASAQHA